MRWHDDLRRLLLPPSVAMLRLLVKFVGLLLLASAFAALVVDGTRSVASGTTVIQPLGQTAATLFPAGFEQVHRFMETHAPRLWDNAVAFVLLLPTWVVLGVLGLLLFILTRARAPKIGYIRR